MVEGTFADAKTLNPVLESDTSSGEVISLIFNGLVLVDPSTVQPAADLATKWDISSDGLTYTFTLGDGIKFQDGQALSSDDVKFTYDLLMNKATNSPRTSELTDRVKSVEAKDPKTVVFTLNHPTAPFLVSNAGYGILPQHALKDVDPAGLAQNDFSTGKKGVTIGTGPFMFEEWVKDDHMTLVKYDGYFKGAPNLDKYLYKVVPNQTVISAQLKTGEIDYSTIQPADLQGMQSETSVAVVPYDTFSFTFYAYQLDASKSDLFQDKAVRQALLYALDRKAMVDAIYFGQAAVAVGTEPVLSWAYAPDQIKLKYDFDVNKANQLLDQAGWVKGSDGIRAKNGKKLSFSVWTNAGNAVREQFVTVFQQQWKKIGIDAKPQTQEWNAFLDRITSSHDFEIFLVGFQWDVDPDQSTMWSSDAYNGGFNMNKYNNAEVDKILKDALETSDINKRKQLYIQMQNIVMDDLPSAILVFPKALAVVNKRVHNLFPNAVSVTFNAHQWWVNG
ncbi:MAG TPA: ABC transporter substrate-binding protein [Nitrolancea sp.]|nr:ABC transporter substrate-binding protein [Nitrolancea sp.]